MKHELVLDFKDQDGKRYIFTKKNFDKHVIRHVVLKEEGYFDTIKVLVRNCLPDMIYPSYSVKGAFAYYDSLGDTLDGTWYNIVIIFKDKVSNVYHIATAYRFRGEIREKKYKKSLTTRP